MQGDAAAYYIHIDDFVILAELDSIAMATVVWAAATASKRTQIKLKLVAADAAYQLVATHGHSRQGNDELHQSAHWNCNQATQKRQAS